MGVPFNPHPPTPSSFPCFCKIYMHRSIKMARLDAVRTTHYPLILMLCCDVFIFLVNRGVPCNEDFECLHPSCLLNGKTFFRAFLSILNRKYEWCVTKSLYLAMTVFLTVLMNLLAQIICSDLVIVFYICYHAGGSTKHLRPPKVKRCDEESSPSDALTPKIKKTNLAGEMRTYLWACPLTPHPHPQPLLPFSCFCKIKVRGSSKMAWIDAVRTTHYSILLFPATKI